tara:strand:- start:17709 stop:18401 length:693 start_codon:yes stop_codon:yes gene_type:complete
MNKINIILASIFLTLSPTTYSEILEVFTWKSSPGKIPTLIQHMRDSAVIHKNLGAEVHAYQLDVGSPNQAFDYVLRWDDLESWAATKEAQGTNKEMINFWKKVGARPSGELIASLEGINLDNTVKANSFDDYPIYRVFIWNPAPGKMAEVLNNFAKAKKIHESLGAKIDSYREGIGGTGNLHYLMSFKSWADMAKFSNELDQNKEWIEFQLSTDPNSSTLVKSFQGFQLF